MKKWEAVLIAIGLRDLPLRDDDTEYPPFKRRTPCPKCGFDGVDDTYDEHSSIFISARTEVQDVFRVSFPERMWRHCRRCGAEWHQLPMDASGAAG